MVEPVCTKACRRVKLPSEVLISQKCKISSIISIPFHIKVGRNNQVIYECMPFLISHLEQLIQNNQHCPQGHSDDGSSHRCIVKLWERTGFEAYYSLNTLETRRQSKNMIVYKRIPLKYFSKFRSCISSTVEKMSHLESLEQ